MGNVDIAAWALRMGRCCCMQWACIQIFLFEMGAAVEIFRVQGWQLEPAWLLHCSSGIGDTSQLEGIVGERQELCHEFHSDASWRLG